MAQPTKVAKDQHPKDVLDARNPQNEPKDKLDNAGKAPQANEGKKEGSGKEKSGTEGKEKGSTTSKEEIKRLVDQVCTPWW